MVRKSAVGISFPDGSTLTSAAPAQSLVPWDASSIVTTIDFRSVSASGVFTANQGRGSRVRIPKTGILHDLCIGIGTASGNISVAVYDVGATTPGTRTRLYTTGAIACPVASVNLAIVGDPSLAVTEGQYLEFWVSIDNATAAVYRASTASIQLPSSYSAPAGGLATPNAFALVSGTAHPLPTTISGSAGAGGILPLIAGRVA